VTDDGRYAVLTVWSDGTGGNRFYFRDLKDQASAITGEVVRLLDDFDASYAFVGTTAPCSISSPTSTRPRARPRLE